MTREEILNEMALAAVNNFEFSCSWASAANAALQEARDLRHPSDRAFVGHAVHLAKMMWNERVVEAKKIANN